MLDGAATRLQTVIETAPGGDGGNGEGMGVVKAE